MDREPTPKRYKTKEGSGKKGGLGHAQEFSSPTSHAKSAPKASSSPRTPEFSWTSCWARKAKLPDRSQGSHAGAHHVSGNHELDAPVLLATRGCGIIRHGLGFAEAPRDHDPRI